MLRLIETGTMGVFNADAQPDTSTMDKLLAACRSAGKAESTLTWVPADYLRRYDLSPWLGLPCWVLLALCALAPPVVAQPAALSPQVVPAAPVAHAPVAAPAHALTEAEKIQALISTVEKSQGLQFIRNGSVHDPAAAASHLRLKWKHAGKRVHTAEDFIRYCATGSSMSGKPYQIRHPSGRVENAADYFHAQLRRLEMPGSTVGLRQRDAPVAGGAKTPLPAPTNRNHRR